MTKQTNIAGAQWDSATISALPDSSFAFVDANGGRHLPYKAADGRVDLPHVRNALARLEQVNMTTDQRQNTRDKLQGSLKASAGDDMIMRSWSAIQATNGNELPTRVMLLRSGNFNTQKYGEVPISADSIPEYKKNFENGLGMADDGKTGIPVDFAHKSHLKAAAWVKRMEVEADDSGNAVLWGTDLEWSDSGRKAILGKEFKCLSSDFYPAAFGEWVDPESGVTAKNVIVGAALTNRPMFTGNQTVTASEEDANGEGVKTVIYINASENKELSMDLNVLRVKAAADVSGAEQRFLQAHEGELSAEEKKKFEIIASQKVEPKVIQASAVTGTEGVVQVQAADLKKQNDTLTALHASVGALEAGAKATTEAEVNRFVDEHIARGAIVADQKATWVATILASADNKKLLEALPGSKLLASTQGSDKNAGDSASAAIEMSEKATAIMAAAPTDAPISIQDAMVKAAQQNKDLADRVLAERRSLAGVQAAA